MVRPSFNCSNSVRLDNTQYCKHIPSMTLPLSENAIEAAGSPIPQLNLNSNSGLSNKCLYSATDSQEASYIIMSNSK